MEGFERGMPVERLLTTLVSGFFFSLRNDQGKALASDESFESDLREKGFKAVLTEVCGIDRTAVVSRAEALYNRLAGRVIAGGEEPGVKREVSPAHDAGSREIAR